MDLRNIYPTSSPISKAARPTTIVMITLAMWYHSSLPLFCFQDALPGRGAGQIIFLTEIGIIRS
jgi:hypothetical protein